MCGALKRTPVSTSKISRHQQLDVYVLKDKSRIIYTTNNSCVLKERDGVLRKWHKRRSVHSLYVNLEGNCLLSISSWLRNKRNTESVFYDLLQFHQLLPPSSSYTWPWHISLFYSLSLVETVTTFNVSDLFLNLRENGGSLVYVLKIVRRKCRI